MFSHRAVRTTDVPDLTMSRTLSTKGHFSLFLGIGAESLQIEEIAARERGLERRMVMVKLFQRVRS
jgi:hypothetical protein